MDKNQTEQLKKIDGNKLKPIEKRYYRECGEINEVKRRKKWKKGDWKWESWKKEESRKEPGR